MKVMSIVFWGGRRPHKETNKEANFPIGNIH